MKYVLITLKKKKCNILNGGMKVYVINVIC